MSLGFLGIQMGFAQQNANVCCILQTFAAAVKHLSPFWLLAPVTGMLAGDKKKLPRSVMDGYGELFLTQPQKINPTKCKKYFPS